LMTASTPFEARPVVEVSSYASNNEA
jgi:hypothetical protein